ncbi:MAG: DUF1254 domain-containing protein [Rhodoferax sp.]|nr:DUF1254 domain-containing protein [Rhodoferax sp.]MBP9929892.1 DUF1254 domain-containing protein [Rhodoferax sp.]HQX58286.1 DUF1254 domain-containing protein [Burkholderiaceae bacterium]HQZ06405.1 DUF1254 domain-containing protein [Burkholderiaceae bacterium]
MSPSAMAPARRSRRRKTIVAMAFLLPLVLATTLYPKVERVVLGAEAYIFGFPLVIMDLTRTRLAQPDAASDRLQRVRAFPDSGFRGVVRPNVDTLYSNAFIDMDQGPWVFEMPANAARYTVMPFMDAWTDVFASPGTRTLGDAGGRFLLAGPHWQGTVPPGWQLLRAPTRMVWLIGRTETRGVGDYPVVHRLQDALVLRPQVADANPVHAKAQTTAPAAPRGTGAPIDAVQQMPVQEFFDRLAMLMVDNPPRPADAPMLAKLARLGIAPGYAPRWSRIDRWAVALGRAIANHKIRQALERRVARNGWITPPAILGNFGTAYDVRTVVAMIGLGANLPADAMYPSASVDGQGQTLNGSHRYRLHFERSQLPPVDAFWSLTAYGDDDFFIDNPLHRYARASNDPLVRNPDGSLDLLVQADPPPPELQANWLPVRASSAFLLQLRLYRPRSEALDGSWSPPALQRVD